MSDPKPEIKYYNNPGCPWAQRVQVVLRELNLPYEEIYIDLDKPRSDWFLEINPRGVVPALSYKDSSKGIFSEIILRESALIVEFLIDSYGPNSHLIPALPSLSTDPATAQALFRHHALFLTDAYVSRIHPKWIDISREPSRSKREAMVPGILELFEKEIEPLLAYLEDSSIDVEKTPFFLGSDRITLAEVLMASLMQRWYDFSDDILFPKAFREGLEALPRFSRWARKATEVESIKEGYDGEWLRQRVVERKGRFRPEERD